jgi:hypothetical protein
VSGLIVGPGFIDLHSHVHSIAGQQLQALDGVTTSLELEAGLMPVAEGYRRAGEEGRPLNYGFSASRTGARGQVLAGIHPTATSSGLYRCWLTSDGSSPRQLLSSTSGSASCAEK